MQDTFFDSGRKCVAMVTAYYGKNGGKILRRELLPQFFTNSHKIWHRCLPWGVDVQDTFFDSGRKCVAMVTAYYGKNWGKILRRELLPQFFTNSHKIWHRCLPLGVDVQDTFFDSGRKCVAMVTAYYTVKKYCGAGVLITFSDISSFLTGSLVSPKHHMKGHSRHNSSLIGRENQAKFENDCVSRNGHRIQITQPNSMILVSFSCAEDALLIDFFLM